MRGERLPLLSTVLADSTTRWQCVSVAGWYGDAARDLQFVTGTAVWYHGGMPHVSLRWVPVRDPFGRFGPQALLYTDLKLTADAVVGHYVRRRQVEVTFAETRRHVGAETQPQWGERGIARTTPILLGLFSLVTVLAMPLVRDSRLPDRTAAWYAKSTPTFSDSLGAVRHHLCRHATFCRRELATC